MAPLKGVNRVRTTAADGQRVERWYAWRGKGAPCILAESAVSDRVLDIKVAAAATKAGERYFEIMAARKAPAKDNLLGLIKAWLASPEFATKSARTQRDYRAWIRAAESDLGALPLVALKADGCRATLLKWRNGYASTPANADHFASALSNCLAWARDQGLTSADPMRSWPWIYRPDRSDIVWSAAELEAVCASACTELQLAILLAAYSGLRQCDLIRLTWSAVSETHIVRRTSKRGKVVHIPITPALKQVLDTCRAAAKESDTERLQALTVLTKNGKPWIASTLNKGWQAAREAAGKKLPQIIEKRWHDMRGTYATSLHREGYLDDEVDRIMGWAKGNSEQTRAAYVSGDVVAQVAIARARRRFAAAGVTASS
jgi:integrase